MLKKIVIVLSLLILPLSKVIASEELAPQKSLPIVEKLSKSKKINVTVDNEYKEKADLYKLLYENSKSSNERFINTVIGFLLALFGAQLVFNFKIKKEEIDIIKSDINKQISLLHGNLKGEINTLNKENNKALRDEIFLNVKQINDNLNIRFSDESKLATSKVEKQEQKIEFVKGALENEIKRVGIQLEKTIGDVLDLRSINSNALGRYIKTAILELENDHEVKYTLTDIIKLLNKQKDLHEHDKNQLEKLASVLPEKFESQKDMIRRKLDSLKIYKFIDDPLNPEKRIVQIIREATA